AGKKPQQAGAPELRVPDRRAGSGFAEPAAGHLHAAETGGALPAIGRGFEPATGGEGFGAGALQSADRQLGGTDSGIRASAAQDERRWGRFLGPGQRELSSELRRATSSRTLLHERGQ